MASYRALTAFMVMAAALSALAGAGALAAGDQDANDQAIDEAIVEMMRPAALAETQGRPAEAAEQYLRCAEAVPVPRRLTNRIDCLERALGCYLKAKEFDQALAAIDRLAGAVKAYPERFLQPYADQHLARRIAAVEQKRAAAGGAKAPFKLTVNGEQFTEGPAPQVIDGALMVPAKVVDALGARVRWSEETRRATIWSESPWMIVDPEPLRGRIFPYDPVLLGPAITLRHHLSEMQWASLNQPVGSAEPMLARFEIVDGYRRDSWDWMPNMQDPLRGEGGAGFLFRAMVYWAYPDRKDALPRCATRITVQRGEQGQFTGESWQTGARLDRVRIDAVEYRVKPNEVSDERPAPAGSEIVQGASGWTVEQGKTLSSRTLALAETNDVLPTFDLSVQAVRSASRPPFRLERPHPPEQVDPAALEQEMRAELERLLEKTDSLTELMGNPTIVRDNWSYSLRDGVRRRY